MIYSTGDPIHAHCCIFSSKGKNLLLLYPEQNILFHHYTTEIMFVTVMTMIWDKKTHNRHKDSRQMDGSWLGSVVDVWWVMTGGLWWSPQHV